MFKKLIQLFMGEPTNYVSDIDKFMAQQTFKVSLSQQQEIARAQRIIHQRD
jgi:hypothetical protein